MANSLAGEAGETIPTQQHKLGTGDDSQGRARASKQGGSTLASCVRSARWARVGALRASVEGSFTDSIGSRQRIIAQARGAAANAAKETLRWFVRKLWGESPADDTACLVQWPRPPSVAQQRTHLSCRSYSIVYSRGEMANSLAGEAGETIPVAPVCEIYREPHAT